MTPLRSHLVVPLQADTSLLAFAHRQTQVLRGWLRDDDATRVELEPDPGLIALTIPKRDRIAAGNRRIEVEYQGLPPVFVEQWPSLSSLDDDQKGSLDPSRRLAVRLRLILDLPAEARPFAEAWARFDQATDWTGLPTPSADEARSVGAILMNRVVRRAGWAAAARPMPEATMHEFRRSLLSVETVFRDALDVFHAPGGTRFEPDFFAQAFAGFVGSEFALRNASGTYRVPTLKFAGVPDSAMFYCFAEAAICFIQLGRDVQFWRWLLRHFVAGARLFTDSYWDGSRRDRYAYSKGALAVPLPRNEHLQLVAQLAADTDSLIETFGTIAQEALGNELNGLNCGAGAPPRERVAVTFKLLRRSSTAKPAATTGQSPSQPAPEEPTYEDVSGQHQQLLRGLLTGTRNDAVPLVDDPDLQRDVLDLHARRRFQRTSTQFAGRPVRMKPCAGKPSTWNPDTKQCDPPQVGASLRFKMVAAGPGDDPCAPSVIDDVSKDTDFELIVATANARTETPPTTTSP